jgi:hypothetical protein
MAIQETGSLLNRIIRTVQKARTSKPPSEDHIGKLSREIKQIKNETNYIKEHGKQPPKTPNYMRYLDIIK